MIALFATIRYMKIITFSGVDGSGKSTQLALLKKRLEETGKTVAYFHAVEFSLANTLATKKDASVGSAPKKAVTEASWFTVLLRKIILPIDLIRFRFYANRLKKQGTEYLLSDRYFYDTLINIEYLSKQKSTVPAAVFCFLIRPDVAFYIDLPGEVIMARERAPEQGLEYLKRRYNGYPRTGKGKLKNISRLLLQTI
jgi:thymidylate kinase